MVAFVILAGIVVLGHHSVIEATASGQTGGIVELGGTFRFLFNFYVVYALSFKRNWVTWFFIPDDIENQGQNEPLIPDESLRVDPAEFDRYSAALGTAPVAQEADPASCRLARHSSLASGT